MVEAERSARRPGPLCRHRRGARPVLQRRHRARDGRVPSETRRALRPARLRRVFCTYRGAGPHDLSRLHGLQARIWQSGSRAAADAEHPRAVRSESDGLRERRLPSHRGRSDEARVRRPRHLLRGSCVCQGAGRRAPVQGLCEGARGPDRSEARVDVLCRRRSAQVRPAGEAVDVLEGERSGRRDDGARGPIRWSWRHSARTPRA